MKNSVLYLIILSSVMLSCRNGEDIGPLYGQWTMMSMTVDGQEANVDLSVYNWRFQQDIVMISRTFPIQEFDMCAGTWSRRGEELTLNFGHHSGEDNIQGYTPPAALLLPRGITVARISDLTSRNLTMSFEDLDGQTVVYKMKKLN